jgi:HD-GYP domain-containing protein (c-di-GMP phosphodiesterase class II)
MRSQTRRRVNAALSVATGVSAGLLIYRENKSRRLVERVAAAALETLLNAIEANDEDTGMHVRRVAAYALVIGDEAGLEDHQCRSVERIALFHDVGKIHQALFDIVHDGKPLSQEERRKIATHPRRGAQVLAPLATFYPDLPAGVVAHHERWDGKGYPRGLRGEQIPLAARVVTIADTFDALTHSRRYRRGRSIAAALAVIRDGRGKQFDPALVDLVLEPHVVDRLTRTHRDETKRHAPGEKPKRGRRSGPAERAPDVSFRWRSESLGR